MTEATRNMRELRRIRRLAGRFIHKHYGGTNRCRRELKKFRRIILQPNIEQCLANGEVYLRDRGL